MASDHRRHALNTAEWIAKNRAIDARIAETASTVRMAPTQGPYTVLDEHGRVVERRGEID